MRRISGATILDGRLGKKHQVVQVIDGDSCQLVITTAITQPENIARVKQVIHNNECELNITEVQ